MKVIGKDKNNNYIAIISHYELEKFTNLYYGKLKALEIGSEFDLAQGYDFSQEIRRTCDGMTSAYNNFKQASDTLLKFSSMVLEQQPKEGEDK